MADGRASGRPGRYGRMTMVLAAFVVAVAVLAVALSFALLGRSPFGD